MRNSACCDRAELYHCRWKQCSSGPWAFQTALHCSPWSVQWESGKVGYQDILTFDYVSQSQYTGIGLKSTCLGDRVRSLCSGRLIFLLTRLCLLKACQMDISYFFSELLCWSKHPVLPKKAYYFSLLQICLLLGHLHFYFLLHHRQTRRMRTINFTSRSLTNSTNENI